MEPIGTFYAGILDYGDAAPDFEGLAEAVNFLRASNVKVMVGKASYDKGGARFPFLLKEPEKPLAGIGASSSKNGVMAVKRMFSHCDVTFHEVIPSAENASQLHLIAEVAAMDPEHEVARARDFKPATETERKLASDPFANLIGLAFIMADILDQVNAFMSIGSILTISWCVLLITDYYLVRGVMKIGSYGITLRTVERVNWRGVITLATVTVVNAVLYTTGVLPIPFLSTVPMTVGLYVVLSWVMRDKVRAADAARVKARTS